MLPLTGREQEHIRELADVALWIHGGPHSSFDCYVNETRVVVQSTGYAKGGVAENPQFDPDFPH